MLDHSTKTSRGRECAAIAVFQSRLARYPRWLVSLTRRGRQRSSHSKGGWLKNAAHYSVNTEESILCTWLRPRRGSERYIFRPFIRDGEKNIKPGTPKVGPLARSASANERLVLGRRLTILRMPLMGVGCLYLSPTAAAVVEIPVRHPGRTARHARYSK